MKPVAYRNVIFNYFSDIEVQPNTRFIRRIRICAYITKLPGVNNYFAAAIWNIKHNIVGIVIRFHQLLQSDFGNMLAHFS